MSLHERPVLPKVVEAARRILNAIPGLELVDLEVPRVGTMSNSLTVLPDFKTKLREREFEAAEAAGVDTLATIFHACHREICHFESGRNFEIVNFMELLGESLGVHHEDVYKRLKLMQDIDAIVRDSEDPHRSPPPRPRAGAGRHPRGHAVRPLRGGSAGGGCPRGLERPLCPGRRLPRPSGRRAVRREGGDGGSRAGAVDDAPRKAQ